jgi:predicted transposase/invertase (TIGR01784 family)
MSVKNPSPTNDYVFRWLFSTEGNQDLLIAFLNGVLQPEVPITAVVIKNPFNLADYDGSKETILDIKAMDQNGVWYDVEMQLLPHIVYGKRALFYGATVYVGQLERGSDYSKLNTTICIHILGFNYFKDDDRVFRRVVFKDDETNEVYEDFRHLQFHFMELPKFHKDWMQISTGQEKWAAFFKEGHK